MLNVTDVKQFHFAGDYGIMHANGGDGMKRALLLALCLVFACVSAVAEGFDQAALEQMEGFMVLQDAYGVNTIVRPEGQPYAGTIDIEDAELETYLDYIQMPDEDATFLRLMVCLTSWEYVGAKQLTITVGDKDYVFRTTPETAEYDLTYFEDYTLCMTDESLPMIKAMARSKQDTFPIELMGEWGTWHGSITLPLDTVAKLYDTYIDLGGTSRQDLSFCRDTWPVMIMKHE